MGVSTAEWQFLSGGGQFWANDVARSIEWYSRTLGFEAFRDYKTKDGAFVYVHLRRGNAQLLIMDKAKLEATGVATLPVGGRKAVSIKVEGLQGLSNDLDKRITNPQPLVTREGPRFVIKLVKRRVRQFAA